jgi:hypothetical protein
MQYLIIFAVGLWFLRGDPPKSIANMFWEDEAAPWETVDAYVETAAKSSFLL